MQNKKQNTAKQAEELKLQQIPDIDNSKNHSSQKFSVGKIAKYCKHGRFVDRVGAGAPVYISAVLEYITAELIELAEHQLKKEQTGGKKNKERITPRHIMLAIRGDPELSQFFGKANFCQAGVVPQQIKSDKKKEEMMDSESEDDEYASA